GESFDSGPCCAPGHSEVFRRVLDSGEGGSATAGGGRSGGGLRMFAAYSRAGPTSCLDRRGRGGDRLSAHAPRLGHGARPESAAPWSGRARGPVLHREIGDPEHVFEIRGEDRESVAYGKRVR